MTQTEALKLALEALKKSHPYSNTDKDLDKHSETITAIKAALEAKDEPVAWIKRSAKGNIYDLLSEPDDGYEPVYTTQPQRKPLTDKEIDALREANSEGRGAGWRFNFKGFARAIEAAHGIKGQA